MIFFKSAVLLLSSVSVTLKVSISLESSEGDAALALGLLVTFMSLSAAGWLAGLLPYVRVKDSNPFSGGVHLCDKDFWPVVLSFCL